MDDNFFKYNSTGAIDYSLSQQVNRVPNCFAFLVVNTGDTIVRVNGHILYPGVPGTTNGDTFSQGGYRGGIFLGTIQITFDAGATPAATVDQLFYILPNQI